MGRSYHDTLDELRDMISSGQERKVPDMATGRYQKQVILNKEEFTALREAAKISGMSEHAFMRAAIAEKTEQVLAKSKLA